MIQCDKYHNRDKSKVCWEAEEEGVPNSPGEALERVSQMYHKYCSCRVGKVISTDAEGAIQGGWMTWGSGGQ